MRIIAGELKSRQFVSPRTKRTHPMGDKVRAALFNVLGDISGLSVLDAYAGSGALAFESISRGAAQAVTIDIDKKAHLVITQNTSKLGVDDKVRSTRANVTSWSKNNRNRVFDIVFCDPPYDSVSETHIQLLSRHVAADGTLVLSWPGSERPPVLPNLQLLSRHRYAEARLLFYKRA